MTEAQASTAAIASGEDIVVSALTTETTLVTAHPDGSFTQEVSVVPERVKKSTSWVDVDPTLTPSGSGRLAARAGMSASSVSDGGSDALVRVQNTTGQFFELRWVKPLPAPSVSGDTAVYAEVLPGVDLVAISSAMGFSTYFVVKSRAAVSQLTPAMMRFTWAASSGLAPVASPTAFDVVDTAGGVVFGAPALAMWDSADDQEPDSRRDSENNRRTLSFMKSKFGADSGKISMRKLLQIQSELTIMGEALYKNDYFAKLEA